MLNWTSSSSQVSGDHDVEHEREHEVDGHVEVGDDEGEEREDAGVAARTELKQKLMCSCIASSI